MCYKTIQNRNTFTTGLLAAQETLRLVPGQTLSSEKWPPMRCTAYVIVLHWMQQSRCVAGLWATLSVHEIGTLWCGMPVWLTAYNCANVNTPADWLHTQEAFCLSQEIIRRTLRNRTKEVSGFPTHIHKIKFWAFWVQMNKWLTCRAPSADRNTALSLCLMVQPKPDLLPTEPGK